MARRRPLLADRRRMVGLSQEKLAEVVGVDRSTVARWENGESDPQPGLRPGLAAALAVSAEQLHKLLGSAGGTAGPAGDVVTCRVVGERVPGLSVDRAAPGPPRLALTDAVVRSGFGEGFGDRLPCGELGGTAVGGGVAGRAETAYSELVSLLAGWVDTVNRREILWLLGLATTGAGAAQWDELDSERVVRAVQAPGWVDDQVVDHLDAMLRLCVGQDDLLGSRATLDTVLAQRGVVRGLLADTTSRLRGRLLSTYAAQSRLAGWLSFDLNRYDAAAGYFEAARQAAHEAQDSELAAFVLCYMSNLATWRGQARVGIDHAVAAQGWADRTDDLRLRAFAWDRLARALARDRQATPARAAIEQAHTLLDRADSERTSHAYFLLAGGAGSLTESFCCVYLGDYDRGIAAAEDDLAGMNPSFARERASIMLTLATCRLRCTHRDVVGAAEAVRQAAALAAHNPSARVAQRLRGSLTELAPWQDVPEVRQVRDELAAHH